MQQVADSGFLVGYWCRSDEYHRWARGLSIKGPLLTCDAVLTEAAHIIGTPVPLLKMIELGDLVSDFDTADHATDLRRWLEKYDDLDPGFTDACVVKLWELSPRAEVLTTDERDFRIYRTLSGKAIRCRFPD